MRQVHAERSDWRPTVLLGLTTPIITTPDLLVPETDDAQPQE